MALGEEGGDAPKIPIEKKDDIIDQIKKDNKKGSYTTMALGEEGGETEGRITTLATNEEGGETEGRITTLATNEEGG